MTECQLSRAQMERLFLLYLAGRCCENLQSARSLAQCKSSPGNSRAKSTDRDKLTANKLTAMQQFRYMISSLISSQSFRHKVKVWARWLWG